MAPHSTELEKRLIERTRLEGPITFREFMRTALYDAELGYYNTERVKIGAQGDFYTSSNVHPAFGAVLAQAFAGFWTGTDEPRTIVEMGAGTGQLAADVLSAFREEHPSIFDKLTYIPLEQSPAMRKLQQDMLSPYENRVRWPDLDRLELEPFRGIVFSNEFVDALPVHRVRVKNRELEEQYVTAIDRQHLGFVWRAASTKRLGQYIERLGIALRENQIVEINLEVIDWLGRMTTALRDGWLVTIDYGDIAQHLWTADRNSGTLRSFSGHRLVDSPLERIGEQDITASVNFTALIEYGRDVGFELISYERQTSFLTRLGLIERIARQYDPGASLDDLKERLAIKNLFVPGGVSDSFRVLIQRRC